jgi:hypothetical protein
MEADNVRRKGTGKTGLALIAIAIGIIALIGLAVYALMIPGVLESVATIVAIVVAAIVVIGIIIYGVILLAAIPVYMAKGEKTQTTGNYNLEDVKPVENSSSDDPKND